MSGNDNEMSADAIRADIEQTRERLGETVEALGEQLNPANITQRVKETVRDATIEKVKTMANDTKNRLADSIRENPIPYALIAGGIGWLLVNRRREQSPVAPAHFESTMLGSNENQHDNVAHKVADGARDAAEKVAATASDAAGRVAHGAKDVADRVASGAKSVAHGVAQQTRTQVQRVETKFEQSPLALGAVAVAVGVAVGLALPITKKEGALMGEKRDQLLDKAREAVADTKDKVRRTAEAAVPEVKSVIADAARSEGLLRERAVES